MNTFPKSEKSGITVHEFKDTDRLDVLRIEGESFTAPWTQRMFESFWASPSGRCFVARKNDALCGYICIYTVPGEPETSNGDAEIANIAVDIRYRRMGVGKMLISKALEFARENACGDIFLEVRRSNISAAALYCKLGFYQYGVRKNYYTKPKEDALLMSRKIGR